MTKPGIQIRPIRTEQDHDHAIARIEELMDNPKGPEERDELDILVTLVDAYETIHHPIDPPDPIAALLFRIDQQQITRKDLEPLIGSRARVSEVLSGKRPLTLAMIRRLKNSLGISADVLIRPIQARSKPRTKRS